MSNKSKYGSLTPVGSILNSMLSHNAYDAGNTISKICQLWNEIAGSQVATNTKPFAIKNSILLVHVSNSAWLQQLMFLKEEMLNNLKNIFGSLKISDIKFKIDQL